MDNSVPFFFSTFLHFFKFSDLGVQFSVVGFRLITFDTNSKETDKHKVTKLVC